MGKASGNLNLRSVDVSGRGGGGQRRRTLLPRVAALALQMGQPYNAAQPLGLRHAQRAAEDERARDTGHVFARQHCSAIPEDGASQQLLHALGGARRLHCWRVPVLGGRTASEHPLHPFGLGQ